MGNREICWEVLTQALSAKIGVEIEIGSESVNTAVQWLNKVKRENKEEFGRLQIRLVKDKIWITKGKVGGGIEPEKEGAAKNAEEGE